MKFIDCFPPLVLSLSPFLFLSNREQQTNHRLKNLKQNQKNWRQKCYGWFELAHFNSRSTKTRKIFDEKFIYLFIRFEHSAAGAGFVFTLISELSLVVISPRAYSSFYCMQITAQMLHCRFNFNNVFCISFAVLWVAHKAHALSAASSITFGFWFMIMWHSPSSNVAHWM